jgi:hypothetical protein
MVKNQWSIGVLLFPGFEVLDVFGPLEMFGMAPDNFDIHLVAEFLRFSGHPDLTNQEIHNAETRPQNDL